MRLKDRLLQLNISISKYHSGLFHYFKDTKLADDILWGGTGEF